MIGLLIVELSRQPGIEEKEDVWCVYYVQGRIDNQKIYSLASLAAHYDLTDLLTLTAQYFVKNLFKSAPDPDFDAAHLVDAPVEAFNTLQVPVQTFNNDGHILHHVRCTGPGLFRQEQSRHDWVFVRRRPPSPSKTPGSLDGRVPARLNAVFKVQHSRANTSYRLAHISLLTVVGSPTPDGPEGMVRVSTPMKNRVVRIVDVEGMAHLIPVDPDKLYLVNNRIDVHTWNDIHDGN